MILFLSFTALIVLLVISQMAWYRARQSKITQHESIIIVSHNLLTPLGRIRYAADVLMNKVSLMPEEEQHNVRELVERILTDAGSLILRTTLLLEYSNLLDRAKIVSFGVTDTPKVVEGVAERFRSLMKNKTIEFVVSVPEGRLPRVAMDELYLQTILEVLLDNALKYTPIGGRVELSVKSNSKTLTFSVSDTGVGMPSEKVATLFSQPYLLRTTSMVKDSGMGLGLMVSRHIIERHGGRISAISPGEGRGSTFVFSVPLHRGHRSIFSRK